MKSMHPELEDLNNQLKESNARLELWENIAKKDNTTKENQSLKQQLSEATSKITELTKQLSNSSPQKDAQKVDSATSELSSLREKAKSQKAKITELESSTKSLETQKVKAKALADELLSGNENADKLLAYLMSERDELELSVKESKGTITSLEAEKAEAVAKATSLEDTVKELKARLQHRSAQRDGADASMQSTDFADKEADYQSAIATLEESARQQNEESLELKRILSSSQAQGNDLSGYVSTLTTERDELVSKFEEASSELSKLQSTFDLLVDERDAAEATVRELLTGEKASEEVMSALNSEKEVLVAKIEECIARLYSEKEDSPRNRDVDYPRFDLNGESLEKQLQSKYAEVKRLSRDKEKLEAYTKQTLQIFQQKYFATTQNYKTQLKGMTQQIQALESELANHTRSEGQQLLYDDLDLGAVQNEIPQNPDSCAVTDESGDIDQKLPPLPPPEFDVHHHADC